MGSELNAVNYFTVLRGRENKRYNAHLNAQISHLSNKLVCRLQKENIIPIEKNAFDKPHERKGI